MALQWVRLGQRTGLRAAPSFDAFLSDVFVHERYDFFNRLG